MRQARDAYPASLLGVLACLGIGLGALPCARASDDVTRVSEITERLEDSWATPGFRLTLRLGYAHQMPFGAAPRMTGAMIAVEPGLRLNAQLSGTLFLQYTVVSAAPLTGLHWVLGIGPTWHVGDHASLTAGLGYVGVDLTRGADACLGTGVASWGRASYLVLVGDLFATGPVLQGDVQYVTCQSRAIAHGRWWHRVAQVAWAFTWR